MSEQTYRQGSISVLIPTYGHAMYIGQTLDSILSQTRPAHEIIVINDGSPDDTGAAVRPYLDRIRYIEQENRGLVETLNRGIGLCRGDYIWILGSDDWLAPDALETLAAVLDRHPDVGLVHGGITVVDAQGRPHPDLRWVPYPAGRHRDIARLFTVNYIAAPAVLCRAAALRAIGPVPNYKFCQDWAMWFQLAYQGWFMYGVARPVAFYRRHGNNLTDPQHATQARQEEVQMRRAMAPLFVEPLLRGRRIGPPDRHLLRLLGWFSLAHRDRAVARRAFRHLLITRPDFKSATGLALAYVPGPVYANLKKARNRWRRLHGPGR
jgi:glycosyl transferase family 2